jgi:HEAT repeat protein
MRTAFLTYAPADQRTAVRLWDELRWHGLDVGIDLQDAPLHLERSAVLEDIVFQCRWLLVLVGPHIPDETRRLCALAIEQEADVVALLRPSAALPDALRVTHRMDFTDYDIGLTHLLSLMPDGLFNRAIDPDRVLGNLHHDDAQVRRMTLFMVGGNRLLSATSAAMALMLYDHDPEVRATAAWALDQLNNVEAASALVAALQDPAYNVRSNAGWGLVNMGRRRDSPASRAITQQVIAVLRDGKTWETREMAHQVLVRLGGEDAQDAIDRYWDGY